MILELQPCRHNEPITDLQCFASETELQAKFIPVQKTPLGNISNESP